MFAKISGAQLFTMLYISRVFSSLTYNIHTGSKLDGLSILIGSLISLFVQILIVIPIFKLYHRIKDGNIITAGYNCFGKNGIVIAWIYAIYAVLVGINTIVQAMFFLDNAVYTNANSSILVLMFIGLVLYGAISGVESISRVSAIFGVFFVVAFLFIFTGLISNIDIYNLSPIFDSPIKQIGVSIFDNLGRNTELVAFILLYPYTKGDKKKTFMSYLILSTITIQIIVFLITTVLANYSGSLVFPFYTLTTISYTSIFQRLDSLHMALWIVLAFIKATMYIFIAYSCISISLPNIKKGYIFSVIFIAISISVYWIQSSLDAIRYLQGFINSGFIVLILVFILPLIVYIVYIFKKENSVDKKNIVNTGYSIDAI